MVASAYDIVSTLSEAHHAMARNELWEQKEKFDLPVFSSVGLCMITYLCIFLQRASYCKMQAVHVLLLLQPERFLQAVQSVNSHSHCSSMIAFAQPVVN